MLPLRGGIFLFLLFLFLPTLVAKFPGTYFDYIYLSNYVQPSLKKIELNCSFFFSSKNNSCEILEKLPSSAKESVLLSLIKKPLAHENQDWIRHWNSQLELQYENSTFYPSQYFDGAYGENNSLRNVWIKLLYFYPSVFDEKDEHFYLPSQIMIIRKSNLDFVINDSKKENSCKIEHIFYGYSYKIKTFIKNFSTEGLIIPISNILEPGEKANLTISLEAKGEYDKKIYTNSNHTFCDGLNCTVVVSCQYNQTEKTSDYINLNFSLPIKYYPNVLEYENIIAVPKKGFANGIIKLKLPKDFLEYKIKIKDEFFSVKKNEVKITKRGENYPLLQLNLVASPSKTGNLNILQLAEAEDEKYYYATLTYRTYVEKPEIGEKDCTFELSTPFYTKKIDRACESIAIIPNLEASIEKIENGVADVVLKAKDQLGVGLKNARIEFSGGIEKITQFTNNEGIARIKIEQTSQPKTIIGQLVISEEHSPAKTIILVPAKKIEQEQKIKFSDLVGILSIIFLIIIIVMLLMKWLSKRSGGTATNRFFLLLIFSVFFSGFSFSELQVDVAQTLEACKNYDFDSAIRNFGECAEAYRIITEFNSMRNTANILINNIAPLVLAIPNIEPYKISYANMLIIALALFRVAWAFNSFYLILNIFNPQKRSEALKQYIWLGVFVIIAYFSYSIIVQGINLINQISEWIIGEKPQEVLLQSTISAEFLAENYEMLKLTLPFLNLTYLILLSRYILIIGLFLLLPFSLLLFFNAPTKGFGKALLGITFMIYFLSIINSILLLIYKMFMEIGDEILQNTLSSTFFTSTFVIFFGFADLVIIIVSILGSIALMGGK
ncbi:MAG: hypothetical protein QXH71_04550 [Candidatus Anstonellaceae archaeon]